MDNNYFEDKKDARRLISVFLKEREVIKARDILGYFLKWLYEAGYYIGWGKNKEIT